MKVADVCVFTREYLCLLHCNISSPIVHPVHERKGEDEKEGDDEEE